MNALIKILRAPLWAIAGLSLVVNLLMLAPALFMLQLFDRVMTSQSRETLLMLLIGMGVALLLMLVFDYLRSRLQGVAGNLISESLSPSVVRTLIEKTARQSEKIPSEGLRDIGSLRALFSAQGLIAVFDTPWALVYIAVIWLAHPWLGAAACVAVVLMLLLALVNHRLTRREIAALQKEASRTTRYLDASMQNAEVVEALGMSGSLLSKWRKLSARVNELQGPMARKSVGMTAITRMTRQAVQVLLQALGAYLVITGEATPGVMVATTLLLGRALSPVEQVVGSWKVLNEGWLAYGRLSRLLGAGEAEPARMALPPPVGKLEAQGLVYRAPGTERMLLAGVSLSLEPGESLAIIGPSGAGKSTLVRLLIGVWKANAGVVRLDHVDLSQWDREDLGPWIGYVPQNVELFSASVAQNISRLGPIDATKVVKAARAAGVHELVLSLPEGYDTMVDQLGTVLSPGQRQRIALARALYGEPKLLVLDEPNSNLDGAGEAALAEALKSLRGQVTVVVVTHRNTLIQHVDKMLLLEAGRVKQYGKVADVLNAIKQQATGTGQVVSIPRAGAGGL